MREGKGAGKKKKQTCENVWRLALGERSYSHSSASHWKVKSSFLNTLDPTTTVVFLIKLYSANKTRAQSRFTGNLIKVARLCRSLLCTAKSNLPSIGFARRSIHLHSGLLGTICGHLGLRERNDGGRELEDEKSK